MTIKISDAELDIESFGRRYDYLPLLESELKQFYGFKINASQIEFDYESKTGIIPIKAKSKQLIAGGNFVAGIIEIEGKSNNSSEFSPQTSSSTIKLDELKKFLEKKGFYRVKVEIKETVLMIEFYTEK